MGSVFVFSDDFFLLLPFFCLPEELRALALLGAPLLPLPSGTPLLPRHPGAMGGRQFPPSLLGRGRMGCTTHHPPRGGSHSQGKSRSTTSLIWEASAPHRRLSSVSPNSSLRAYRGLRPGDRDPIAVARSREVVRIADLGREEKELPFNSYDLFSLNNVKPMRLYKCAKWQNIIVIRVTAKRLKVLEQHDTLCSSRQHL
jgi:hypothetical protein